MKICTKNIILTDFSFKEIVDSTNNFSSSDLVSLIKELQIKKAYEIMEKNESEKENINENNIEITKENFNEILSEFRAGLRINEIEKFKMLYEKFANNSCEDVNKQKMTMN